MVASMSTHPGRKSRNYCEQAEKNEQQKTKAHTISDITKSQQNNSTLQESSKKSMGKKQKASQNTLGTAHSAHPLTSTSLNKILYINKTMRAS